MTSKRLSGSTTEQVDEKFYHAEDLQDPHEGTLHRGLKARQMSMIAVGCPLFSYLPYSLRPS
jgi:amino acid transporter